MPKVSLIYLIQLFTQNISLFPVGLNPPANFSYPATKFGGCLLPDIMKNEGTVEGAVVQLFWLSWRKWRRISHVLKSETVRLLPRKQKQ